MDCTAHSTATEGLAPHRVTAATVALRFDDIHRGVNRDAPRPAVPFAAAAVWLAGLTMLPIEAALRSLETFSHSRWVEAVWRPQPHETPPG
jgi:hypothetical protein